MIKLNNKQYTPKKIRFEEYNNCRETNESEELVNRH